MTEPLIRREETPDGKIIFILEGWKTVTIKEEVMQAMILKQIMNELPLKTLLIVKDDLEDLIRDNAK